MFKQRWFRSLFIRRAIVFILVLVQFLYLIYALISSSITSNFINAAFSFLSLCISFVIVVRPGHSSYKLAWIFLIFLSPILGTGMYLFFNHQITPRITDKKYMEILKKTKGIKTVGEGSLSNAKLTAPNHARLVSYLDEHSGFPVYKNTDVKYFPLGEFKWEAMLDELKKAEKYIFLEYFIIQEGVFWDSILEILKEKAKAGVKVRILYDDFGCFFLLPSNYPKKLKEYGIECVAFNPFRPFLSSIQNNRDHRKICSIDGKVCFTGGINLADEYVNEKVRHGHWKDTAVMLTGEAAWGMTVMFLEMWELSTLKTENIKDYMPDFSLPEGFAEGFVQPYCDTPIDKENVGENVYLKIIQNTKNYLYINTPYLIIDEVMSHSLALAAKSGVDVKITTPGIGDKWFVHETTRSYYRDLINSGVEIYEYEKGFNHAKTFVSDDEIATVGTTNLDFRSLYLHFECGALIIKSPAIQDIKNDYIETLKKCKRISFEDCKRNIPRKLLQNILRLFAPLL
ncbi:MAG: cardiolipin synthase [Clostridia bacterium]|nr:cardiolipin synthase [Clostridia bacterium]